MPKRTILKEKITMEDLAQGVGKVTQQRAGTQYNLGKVDIPYTVLSEEALKELDVTVFTKAKLDGLTYSYSSTDSSGIIPNSGLGSWLLSPLKASDVALSGGATLEEFSVGVQSGYRGEWYIGADVEPGDIWGHQGSEWRALTGANVEPTEGNDWRSLSDHANLTNRDSAGAHPASTITTSSGGTVQDDSDRLALYADSIGKYGNTEDTPSILQRTLDGMGESVNHVLVTPTVNNDYPVSVRDEVITATGAPAGGNPGDVNYYSAIKLSKVATSITSCLYDGNGLGTFSAYDPLSVNQWIIPFIFDNNYQAMTGNVIIDNCGHAIENTTNASRGLRVLGNYARRHNGMGVTGVTGYASVGNVSEETSDSNYFHNSSSNVAHVGNIGHGAIAASGCDVAGGENVALVGNVYADNQFSGVWALKSPNSGALLNNLLVSSNVLSGNTKYPGAEFGQGEMTLGDYNNQAEYQGKAWYYTGNLVDVSAGTNFSQGTWVHKYISAPAVCYNYYTGVDNPSDARQISDEGAEYAAHIGNIGRVANVSDEFVYSTLIIKTKTSGRGATYRNNEGFRIDLDSPVYPEVMHDEDGRWLYNCVLKPNVSDLGLVRLKYDGGFTTYIVKLTITSKEGGAVEKLIVLKGAQGIPTVVLNNSDVYAYGAAIGVLVNTADTNHTDIILQSHSSNYAVKLEVISPDSDRNHVLMFY